MTTYAQGKISYPWDRNAEEIKKLKCRVEELERSLKKIQNPYLGL